MPIYTKGPDGSFDPPLPPVEPRRALTPDEIQELERVNPTPLATYHPPRESLVVNERCDFCREPIGYFRGYYSEAVNYGGGEPVLHAYAHDTCYRDALAQERTASPSPTATSRSKGT